MTAIWPSTLPTSFLAEGYAETLGNNAIRSNMSQGPPKTRRRYTSAPRQVTGAMEMTPDQRETLETFYDQAIASGTLPFEFSPYGRPETYEWLFVEPPTLAPLGEATWRVSMRLIRLRQAPI